MTKIEYNSLKEGQKVITNNLRKNRVLTFKSKSDVMEDMAYCLDENGMAEEILYVFLEFSR